MKPAIQTSRSIKNNVFFEQRKALVLLNDREQVMRSEIYYDNYF